MDIGELISKRKALDKELLALISDRLNAFESSTGVRIRGISLSMTDVMTYGDEQERSLLTHVKTELAI